MTDELSFDELRELERKDRLAQVEHNEWARKAQRAEHEKRLIEMDDLMRYREALVTHYAATEKHNDEIRKTLRDQTDAWREVAAAIRDVGRWVVR